MPLNRPFSIFLTSDDLPPRQQGQYRLYVWHEGQQPRGFAIVFPNGESSGGGLDPEIHESTKQRELRLYAAEQLLAWLDTEKEQPLPPGWRTATDTESAAILQCWSQFAASTSAV